jgi:hypothetical protein
MKIKEIKRTKDSYFVYEVTFTPNWLEKLCGVEEKTKEYKDDDGTYTFGGGNVYIDKSGKELGNGNWIGEAIDRFRRKW